LEKGIAVPLRYGGRAGGSRGSEKVGCWKSRLSNLRVGRNSQGEKERKIGIVKPESGRKLRIKKIVDW